MDRLNLAVIFGGQSSEHEVSCMSAVNIIEQIDKEKIGRASCRERV